ncbi:ComF family protein [Staphylococcus xylosus]|uniref:ComF family protein n=1 Tax=Staphylococcus xylosus TaxID=1288 RepID=UPI0015C528A3|nr:ComF family protein [Staphylococcus xylosus]NQD99302.1 ComF family protein [Staphylococcus xylosus]
MTKCIQCQKTYIEPFNAKTFYKKASKFCDSCLEQWQKAKLSSEKRCPRCLKLLAITETACLDCKFLMSKFKLMHQLYCNYQYQGMVKQLIHQYKFMKDVALAEVLAAQMQLPKTQYDYIVPIPSSREKDQARTFNPVTCVLDQMGTSYKSLLIAKTRPKQSSLGKLHRFELTNPFEIVQNIDLKNKNILLVDDIYTTGLTVHNASAILLIRKIRKFDVFTFAR